MKVLAILAASSLALAYAQQVGQYTAEEHPPLPIQTCTKAGGCKTEQTSLVLDSAYRWLHQVGGYSPCLDNGKWNATVCPDPITCAKNCAYEGVTVADYQNNYGVTVNGDEVTLQYSAKFGARMYLMAPNSMDKYRMFKLLNQEISFDVDGSAMECGMDGGLYLISMEEDGGLSEYPTNKAGARYGTGYCDAQCPTNSFMNGQANFGATTSTGMWGQCCAEMDLWEANKISAVVTSHPSTKPGLYNCTNDVDCGNGGDNFYKSIVDKGGCGFNSYANGAKQYYGPNNTFTIDSSKKVTVITQFITDDHTANGKLVEIRRVYKQDGKVIANSKDSFGYDSITDPYCKAHDNNGPDYHLQHGGLAGMGTELGKGMVLSFTIWADSSSQHNSWLDEGNFGSCPPGSGDPAVLQTMNIDLKLSNIRVGEIGSTFDGVVPTTAPTTSPAPSTTSPVPTTTSPAPTTSSPAPTTTQPVPTTSKPAPTTTAPAGGVPKWGQCGGNGYLGPTTCKEGTCTKYNDWYSQCV